MCDLREIDARNYWEKTGTAARRGNGRTGKADKRKAMAGVSRSLAGHSRVNLPAAARDKRGQDTFNYHRAYYLG